MTRPSPGMLKYMMSAEVGDDVFGDDPTVIALEETAAEMFGKEAALFCPSGTMSNQVAMAVHLDPGNEVICEQGSHVYRYEGGGIAYNSRCSVRLIQGGRGRITARQVLENINPDDIHQPRSSLVVAENTANRGGGSCYDFSELIRIGEVCRDQRLKFHLDGARVFNAIVARGENSKDYGPVFDSISICLSKGLGAPVGSVLIGGTDYIREARRKRKVFGGGMRQAGYLAAAGIYALENNIDRLTEDHQRAGVLAEAIGSCRFAGEVLPVDTNIIIFRLKEDWGVSGFLGKLKERGVLAVGFGPGTIRMVTHLDISDESIAKTINILKNL